MSGGWDASTERYGEGQTRETLPTAAEMGRTNFRTSVINLERPGDASVFGEGVRADAANLIARYPAGQARSALLPMLHLVQSEQGYVTPDGIAFCADTLGLTKAQVVAVATFYTMYKRKPTGEYLVSVCTNTLCGMMGGDEIFATISEDLGVGHNETTEDGAVTIERAECIAACDYAPVVTVNYEFFDNQSVESTRALIAELQAGRRPLPSRGAPLCSFREVERQIAGLFTEADYALDAQATGGPTEIGVQLAIERGDSAPSYAVDGVEPKPAGMPDETARHQEPAKSSGRGGQGGATAEQGATHEQAPSKSDAPLETSESDPSHPADPGDGKES